MAITKPLNTSCQVILGSDGSGTAQIAPFGIEVWNISRLAVHVSTNVKEPIAQVYTGSVAPTNLYDGTYTGSLDASDCSVPLTLMNSMPILCVWTGGDVGATATLSITGTRTS